MTREKLDRPLSGKDMLSISDSSTECRSEPCKDSKTFSLISSARRVSAFGEPLLFPKVDGREDILLLHVGVPKLFQGLDKLRTKIGAHKANTTSGAKERQGALEQRRIVAADNGRVIGDVRGSPFRPRLDRPLDCPLGPLHMRHPPPGVSNDRFWAAKADRKGHLVHVEAVFDEGHRGSICATENIDRLVGITNGEESS